MKYSFLIFTALFAITTLRCNNSVSPESDNKTYDPAKDTNAVIPKPQATPTKAAITLPNDAVFRILIERKVADGKCTLGYLSINDQPATIHTLELPNKNNEPDVSSIPAGTYQAFIRRYNWPKNRLRGWRLELANVSQRDNIQIHAGFWTILPFNNLTEANTKGCILVGTDVDVPNCKLTGDKKAIDMLSSAFNEFEKELVLNMDVPNPKPVKIEVEVR